jgi:hypothetical protein
MGLHLCSQQRPAYRGLDGGDIVQAGVLVPGELNVTVARGFVGNLEEIPATHGQHFLRDGEPAIVAHYAAHQSGAEQHIRPFKELHFAPCVPSRQRGGSTRPAAADDYYFLSHETSPDSYGDCSF